MAYMLNFNSANMLLNAMLRSSADDTRSIGHVRVLQVGFIPAELRNFSLVGDGSDWVVAAGVAELNTPMAATSSGAGTGTVATANLNAVGGTQDIITSLAAGQSTGSKEVVVSDETLPSTGDPCSLTDVRIELQASKATVSMNIALRNRILKYLVRKDLAVFSAAGTLKVYSGSAPASADAAATGVELISFTTSNTSWSAASSRSSALASSLAANGVATGTAGYARFSWTVGPDTFVIQGSIGTTGTDFVISSVSLVSGSPFNLTAATFTYS